MSEHGVVISGPDACRWTVECSCGWSASVPSVVTAAVVWTQHRKET